LAPVCAALDAGNVDILIIGELAQRVVASTPTAAGSGGNPHNEQLAIATDRTIALDAT
jgi:hypothetical protein